MECGKTLYVERDRGAPRLREQACCQPTDEQLYFTF